MANHKSAQKAIRQTIKKTAINKMRVTRMRSTVKKAEIALGLHSAQAADFETAKKAVVAAESELMKVAQSGTIHKNRASRKVSRLTHQLVKLNQKA